MIQAPDKNQEQVEDVNDRLMSENNWINLILELSNQHAKK